MNEQQITELTAEINETSTWHQHAIRDTLKAANERGLLGKQPEEITSEDIKKGDWIAYMPKEGGLGEIYRADRTGDRNYNGTQGTYFRIDRAAFGKEEPAILVEDLEPGTRFKASLLGDERTEFVRGLGDRVFKLGVTGIMARWYAINADFTEVELID